MLRFLGVAALLTFITASASVLARIAGSARPNPAATLFTNPDGSACQPICLFGIRPGETRVDDAVSHLASHPLTRDFEVISTTPFMVRGRQQPDLLVKFSKTPDGLVDSIVLSSGFLLTNNRSSISGLFSEAVVLGNFVSLYGAPDFVCVSKTGVCTAFYVHFGLMIGIIPRTGDVEHITVDEAVSRLALFNLQHCPPARLAFRYAPWLGLTTIERYQSTRTIQAILRADSSLSLSVPCLP